MNNKNSSLKFQWFIPLVFLTLLSFICFLAYVATFYINQLASINEKAYKHPFTVSNSVLKIKQNITTIHRDMKDIVLFGNPENINLMKERITQKERETLELYALVEERYLGDLVNVIEAKNNFIAWKNIRNEVIQLVRNKNVKQASEITRNKGALHIQKLDYQMDELIKFATNKALTFYSESQQAHHRYELKIWFFLAVIILLSFILFIVVFYLRIKAGQQLLDMHNKYHDLYHYSPDILISFNLHKGTIIDCNQTTSQVLGYDRRSLLGMPISKIVADRSIQKAKNYINSAKVNVLLNDIELTLKTATNTTIDISLTSCGEYDENEQIYQTKAFCRDISADRELRDNLKISASVFEYANQAIIITDKDNIIIDVNNKYCQITGYKKPDVIGKSPRILKSNMHDHSFYQQLWERLLANKYWRGEIWNKRKDGSLLPVLSTISIVTDDNGDIKNHIAIFSDITDIKNNEKSLEKLSYYDSLTQLPNRLLLKDRLKQAIARNYRNSKMLAIIFIDLDGFKQVNDLYGHDKGDDVLIELAQGFQEILRESDTLSRQGGDEFIAIVSDLNDTSELTPILERMLEVANSIHEQTSASIGVSLYPQKNITQEMLISQADQAMYQAKQRGKNQYCYYDELHLV